MSFRAAMPVWVSIFMLTFLFCGALAHAYTLDGDLSDWGVTPFSDWTPNSANIDWKQENNINHPDCDPFVEYCDIEAMYMDNDSQYLYYAIVSSSHWSNYWGVNHWASEDLGISFDGDDISEFGASIAGLPVKNTYNENTLYTGTVIKDPVWSILRGHEINMQKEYAYPYHGVMIGGTTYKGDVIGTHQLYRKYWGLEPGAEHHPFIQPGWNSWGYTWILEGRMDLALFGDAISCGQSVRLHLARATCLKDWIVVEGDIDCPNGNGVVPEPSTMALFGLPLIGMAGARIHRRRKK